jgi:hypothetical protein
LKSQGNKNTSMNTKEKKKKKEEFISAVCQICLKEDENNYHFVLGCYHKWEVWETVIKELGIADQCSTRDRVWNQMPLLDREMFTDSNRQRIMILIGLIWSVMWQSYWLVVMEQRPWSSEICMATIRRKKGSCGI